MKKQSRAAMGTVQWAVLVVGLATIVATPVTVHAQAPATVIELAEKDRAARNAAGALTRYDAALATAPNNYDLLWRASRELTDLGEAATSPAQRADYYAKAEAYARRAVAANPNGADGHFILSVALGRKALSVGSRERVKYAAEIHEQASAAVKLDPKHAGALHVLGVWNAEIMRLSGFTRFAARNFLGGKVFDKASWAEATRYMETAVAVDPGRITHRLDLAQIYVDTGEKAKARATCEEVAQMPTMELMDARYKAQCQQLLAKLR